MYENFLRTEMLIGTDGLELLKNKRVAVFGIGGVGSFTAEALARAGIGKLELIDSDIVSPSNLNRQIIALHSTIGRPKVEVMRERILDINPEAEVKIYQEFYLPSKNDELIRSDFDYIAEAIDTTTAKIGIIVRAKELNIPVISCMGTGNKMNPSLLKITDIYETSACPLAKVMRRELRRRGIESLRVVCSEEFPITRSRIPGSVSFVPPVAGMLIAGEIINSLLKSYKTKN